MASRADASEAPLVLHTRVVSGAGGGPDKTIFNSPRFLAPLGYRSECAYLRDPADGEFVALERMAERWRAPLVAVDDHGPLDWRVVRRFEELCAARRPAIWHGHDYKSNLIGLMLARRHPMRLVTTVHGWVHRTWKTPLYYAIDRLCLPHYEAVLCVSPELVEICRRRGVAEERCEHLPNAIDVDEFRRRRPAANAPARRDHPPGRLVVGAIGRLSFEKGFDLLIEAFAAVVEAERHDAELWIAGEGDERGRLEAAIRARGLAERVRLLGYRGDTIDLYEAMDLFVLSSRREGLPNVVLEAMAMETPVLATRVAGVPSLIRDGENGYLVDTGSVDALATGLDAALDAAGGRTLLAAAGRRTIESGYSFEARMRRLATLYDRLLDRRTDAPGPS